MNANLKARSRKQFLWPVAGLVLGIIAATNPLQVKPFALHAGIAAGLADALLVLVLSANLTGARVAVLMAGLFMAVPCFVRTAPLYGLLLAGFLCVPFLAAAGLLMVLPMAGWRARLAHLCAWSDTYPLQRCTRRFDAAALVNLFLATAVLAAAIAIIKTVAAHGLDLPVRWLAGGIGALALGEMATAGPNWVMAALGINVPPFFQSPCRSITISEFWSKRWNRAAGEFLRRCCFAPLARRGAGFAMGATFAISAVGHGLMVFFVLGRWKMAVIFGAFFLVQPLLIATERRLAVRRWRPAAGRAWTLTALAATSALVIEPTLQFLEGSWGGAQVSALWPTLAVLAFIIILSGIVSLVSLAACPAATSVQATGPGQAANGSQQPGKN
ncbi:MAG: MBOAT family protein [Verrucomicrobiae bacterium]|nr:MBOAT family protein [Verrucomicrobiae bacterium]